MDARRFEQMTCSLLDKVKDASEADLYAPTRQRQYGIDAWARYRGGRIVASCKCQAKVRKGEVAQWTADFLDHWESHWRAEGVKHFILVVAAPMHSQQRIDDIATARAAFAAVGVEFEIWSPVQLQERLRDQPGIAGAAVVAALNVSAGVYNVVDDEPLTKRGYADATATAVGRRPWLRAPGRLAVLLGANSTALTRSLRVSNSKLRNASGWKPGFRSVHEGLQEMAAVTSFANV